MKDRFRLFGFLAHQDFKIIFFTLSIPLFIIKCKFFQKCVVHTKLDVFVFYCRKLAQNCENIIITIVTEF